MSIVASAVVSLDGRIGCPLREPGGWVSRQDREQFYRLCYESSLIVMGFQTHSQIQKHFRERHPDLLAKNCIIRGMSKPSVLDSHRRLLLAYSAKGHQVVVIGGAKTFDQLADLVDEWRITIEPVLLGSDYDPPLLHKLTRMHKLELISISQVNRQGTLFVNYRRRREQRVAQ
jgi:dihydrofolate reductase